MKNMLTNSSCSWKGLKPVHINTQGQLDNSVLHKTEAYSFIQYVLGIHQLSIHF